MKVNVLSNSQVRETSADEAANDGRHVLSLSDFGVGDGTDRVVKFLEGIVKHEHKIGNEVIVDSAAPEGERILFVPQSHLKEG